MCTTSNTVCTLSRFSKVIPAELRVRASNRRSERRLRFGEIDKTVKRKLLAANRVGLTAILCVGDQLQKSDGGRASSSSRR
ncbi:MAG: triose-phosphate isomerase [Chloroflexi bacterium]|nr:triose-phosphate isomerase [Chloroflexota bacterium]